MLMTDTLRRRLKRQRAHLCFSPSYQLYLTPELAQVLEGSSKVASHFGDQFVSTEHLFIAIFDYPSQAREIMARFKLEKNSVGQVLYELK